MFDSLIARIAAASNLTPPTARAILAELIARIHADPAGLAGLLGRLQSAGAPAAGLLANTAPDALPAGSVGRALGTASVAAIAAKLHLSAEAVEHALATALPGLIGVISPDGALPAVLPPQALAFLPHETPHAVAHHEGHDDGHGHGHAERVLARQDFAIPAILATLALFLGLIFLGGRTPQAPTAPASVSAAINSVLPRLSLKAIGDTISISGVLPDAATRDRVMAALASVFGADHVRGAIGIDPHAARPAWLDTLPAALAALHVPGIDATFEGAKLTLAGWAAGVDRAKLLAALRGLFGTDGVVLPSYDPDRVLGALKALKPGFSSADLARTLVLMRIEFATADATVPPDNVAVLQGAAALMRQLPAGTHIEIAGYTDNTGDAALNQTLSQARATAVLTVLVSAGVDPAMLTAVGHGDADPRASNDTEEGRAQNRRIEYLVK